MVLTSTNNYFSYRIACAECNHRLIAPNWSEYVSEHHIRHFWSCESCGHRFETSEHLFSSCGGAERCSSFDAISADKEYGTSPRLTTPAVLAMPFQVGENK
jgi:primosomal protein N'